MSFIRLNVALDCSAFSSETFILGYIEPGNPIAANSWKSYNVIEDDHWVHEKSNIGKAMETDGLYSVHLVALN